MTTLAWRLWSNIPFVAPHACNHASTNKLRQCGWHPLSGRGDYLRDCVCTVAAEGMWCPTRPPRLLVSSIQPVPQNMSPLTLVVTLIAPHITLPVHALLDSGSVCVYPVRSLLPDTLAPSSPRSRSTWSRFNSNYPLNTGFIRPSTSHFSNLITLLSLHPQSLARSRNPLSRWFWRMERSTRSFHSNSNFPNRPAPRTRGRPPRRRVPRPSGTGRGEGVMSQISQAPPPISHSDHCHLSFNSNNLHLINTQLSQHYLSTHLTSVNCPISLTRSGLLLYTVTYLKIAYLLFLFLVGPPCLLRLPVFVCHPSSSSVLVRGVCSTTSSTSSWQENHHQYIL